MLKSLFTPRSFRTLVALALGLAGSGAATFAQSYHNMAASDFSASFADIASWSTPTNGSWSGLATGGTGPTPDPLRITTQSNASFSSGSSGGVQKGAEALLFLSTGATDNTSSVALDLLLDLTGRTAGTLSFDAAQVSNSSGNRAGTLSVYASVDGSTWAPLAGSGLPFVATNNVASSASVSVALPSTLNDQSQVRLRFYYHNGGGGTTGSRPKISVDNVLVTSTPAVAGLPEITSPSTAVANAGEAFTYTITASGDPVSYSTSALPDGLEINTATGVISGTPSVIGTFNLTISAVNGVGSGSAVLVLTINPNPNAPVVADGTANATVGVPFSYQISATNSPTLYSSGALPAGLVLDPETGEISGTPTVGGTFNNITITASNSFGSDSGVLGIVVASPPVLQGVYSASTYVNTEFAFSFSATQNPNFYDVTGLPDGLTYDFVTTISGTPTTTGTFHITITATNDLGSDTKTLVLQVLDQAEQDALPLAVVVNKYANGPTGQPDQVELLVLGDGTAGSTADLRGMILKDFSSNMTGDGGGKYEFTESGLWSAVRAGTLIVISTGSSQTEALDAGGFVLKVNLDNTLYFTRLGGTFDIAGTDFVMIKAAGSGALGVAGGVHALGGGVAGTYFNAFSGRKLLGTGNTAAGKGVYANTSNSAVADFVGSDATGDVSPPVFGEPNNGTNQALIDSLRAAAHSALQAWRFQKFGVYEDTAEVLAGDTEDFDGDGIPNLLEYATGTEPTEANAGVVTSGKSGDFLTLSFPIVDDASITYTVLASDDLAAGFTTATGSVDDADGVRTYTDDVSLATPGVRRFLRLEVGVAAE